jgi:hypothetical protein
MMITSEKATQKSITCSRLSVHHASFLWALCQELVLSTTHRFVAVSGVGLPFWAISASSPRSSRRSRTARRLQRLSRLVLVVAAQPEEVFTFLVPPHRRPVE